VCDRKEQSPIETAWGRGGSVNKVVFTEYSYCSSSGTTGELCTVVLVTCLATGMSHACRSVTDYRLLSYSTLRLDPRISRAFLQLPAK